MTRRESNFSRLNLGNSTNYKFNLYKKILEIIFYPTKKEFCFTHYSFTQFKTILQKDIKYFNFQK